MYKYLLVAGLVGIPFFSQGASFDCAKATINVTKLMCQDTSASRRISELDSRTSGAYTTLLENSADPVALKNEQRKWLNDVRNKCLDVTCLETAYTQRIEQLTKNVRMTHKDGGEKQGQIAVGKRTARATQNLSCDKNVEPVLDDALRHAKPLSTNDVRPGPMSGNEVRSGYFYLLPDIAANYADAGCLEKANDILSASPGRLADQIKSDLASSLIKLGLPDKAEELIKTLDSSEKQSELLVELAVLHIRLNDDSKAEDLIDEVEKNTHPRFQGTPTMALVRSLIKNGSVAIAEKYANRDQSAYSTTSLIETAGGYIKQKQVKKGEVLISKALDGCEISDGSCDYALFLTARAFYLAGRPDAAMKYAQRIVAINTRTQTLVEIAGAAPDKSLALKAVEIAKKRADRCKGDNCRYVAIAIAEGYGAAGRADKAVDYLNKHFAKDPIDYAIGLEKAVRQLAKRGKIKESVRLLNQQTTSSPSTDQMKQALAVAELKNGNSESALSTTESIPGDVPARVELEN